jgi:hypothetical protein
VDKSDCSAQRSGTTRVTTRPTAAAAAEGDIAVSTRHYYCYHKQADSHTVGNPAARTSTVEEVRETVRRVNSVPKKKIDYKEAIECTVSQ